MSIILRSNKGSELTWNEVDANWQSLYYSSSLSGNTINFYFTGSNPPVSHSIDLTGMPGLGGVQVYYDGAQVNFAQSFYFTGSGVEVTALPGGGVQVYIPEADSAVGDDKQIQFATGSGADLALSGSANLTFDYNTNTLGITGSIHAKGTDPLTLDSLTERTDLFTVATYDPTTKKIQYRTLPGAGGISGCTTAPWHPGRCWNSSRIRMPV